MKLKIVLFLLAAVAAVQALQAQDAASFSEDAGNKYWIRPDVVMEWRMDTKTNLT